MTTVFIPNLDALAAKYLHLSMAAQANASSAKTQRERAEYRAKAQAFDDARWYLQQHNRTLAHAADVGQDLSEYK
jgi:hypothetical protein